MELAVLPSRMTPATCVFAYIASLAVRGNVRSNLLENKRGYSFRQ
jgi:hypothetical protein